MLTLRRSVGQRLLLYPSDDIPADMTVTELFAAGPIEIELKEASVGRGRIGINAPRWIAIAREELVE